MIKDVIVDVADKEIRLAILEDGVVSEIRIEKYDKKSLVGNIYRGKITRVLSGMQSAFVDIGIGRNAYLYVKDVLTSKYNDLSRYQNQRPRAGSESLKLEAGDMPLSETATSSCHLKSGGDLYYRYNENSDASAHSGNLPDISELLKQGGDITVQVIKDAAGEKGPRVSAFISIAGRYTVYLPYGGIIGISKRIEDQEERQRLKKTAASVKPDEAGLIIRTAAENIDESMLIEDINTLASLWGKIREDEKGGRIPRLLYSEPGIIGHAVREHLSASVNRFLVNHRQTYEKIISILSAEAPDLKARVEYYDKEYDMFEYYHVQSALKEALSRKIWLKSGAYLVFDHTEALTVIDVNSGKFVGKSDMEETAYEINIEAANAVARQIRLRNISGIIIVDFIDMQKKEHKEQLIQYLRNAVKADKIQTVVVGMTNLGLVEMTRKKVRLPLSTHHSH
ncbi:MAG: Rne/Rng family ribonuclease [Acetivibrionales bacterium]|jgi:ribonuclease G